MAPRKVGRIWLMDAAGRITNTVNYDTPMVLRDITLHIAGSTFQAMRQEANGTWVYRYAGPAPNAYTEPHLIDMRNDQDPEWDGPVICNRPATTESLKQHFEILRSMVMSRNAGPSTREFQQLYEHFNAVQEGTPYSWV